ncbi:MAG: glycosyltransferase family 2 protein [Dehalococcoidia bacterium]|nr:glycosyltransferase family 2 protein [Dehalococcoidia bacterium]
MASRALANPMVCVIVLTWNGKGDTLECLASLRFVNYSNFEIVVVDNGSVDGTAESVSRSFPQVKLIINRDNLGFAEGNNVGIRYALENGADYVLLLNNDTIVDSGFVSELVSAALGHPEAGVLGPKIYFYYDLNRIWYAGGKWEEQRAQFSHIGGWQVDDDHQFDNIAATDYICGCALFASARVLREVGLLERKFFLTYEDSDWCFRTRKAGYVCLVVPEARIWHKVSRSFGGEESPMRKYFMTRNWLLWMERNIPRHKKPATYRRAFWSFWLAFRGVSAPTFGGRMAQRRAMLTGILHYALRKFGDCPLWLKPNQG